MVGMPHPRPSNEWWGTLYNVHRSHTSLNNVTLKETYFQRSGAGFPIPTGMLATIITNKLFQEKIAVNLSKKPPRPWSTC
jgi:hypothetical protein